VGMRTPERSEIEQLLSYLDSAGQRNNLHINFYYHWLWISERCNFS